MIQTTALQGRQSADWEVDVATLQSTMAKASPPPMHDATVSSWTYHPDNGLDVIFTVKKGGQLPANQSRGGHQLLPRGDQFVSHAFFNTLRSAA